MSISPLLSVVTLIGIEDITFSSSGKTNITITQSSSSCFKLSKSKIGNKKSIIQSYYIYKTGTTFPINLNSIVQSMEVGKNQTVSFDIKNEGNISLVFIIKEGTNKFSIDNITFLNELKFILNSNTTQTVYWKITSPTNKTGTISLTPNIQAILSYNV